MRFSNSVLFSLALATAANGLVIPKIESKAATSVQRRSDDVSAKIVKAAADVAVPNKYIVVLKNDADIDSVKAAVKSAHKEFFKDKMSAQAFGVDFDFNVNDALKGFTASLDDSFVDELAKNDKVLYVEQDATVHTTASQSGAPWGLSRVSSRDSVDGASTGTYLYDSEGGSGVTAYIVDTGINTDHEDFEGRATWGKSFATDGDSDGVGHGTHCAGTIGGKTYGVAKKADLVAVKVLGNDGQGTNSDVIQGINYVASQHKSKSGTSGYKGSTANMSLGGSKSTAVNDAADAAVAAGVHFAVAAGNDNEDACNSSPASAENVITVAASDNTDTRADFSNFGSCVDIFGPGVDILSAWIGSTTATNTISGTSMATPHITGLLTYLLSLAPANGYTAGDITPAQMKSALVAYGTSDAISDVQGSPNVLGYNGAGGDLSDFFANF